MRMQLFEREQLIWPSNLRFNNGNFTNTTAKDFPSFWQWYAFGGNIRTTHCIDYQVWRPNKVLCEAKLCIIWIVSGIRNRPNSDLYFSLIFYAVLDSTNKYLNHCTAQNCSKNRQICGIRDWKWNPQIVSGIRKFYVETSFCLRIPFTYIYMCSSLQNYIFYIHDLITLE